MARILLILAACVSPVFAGGASDISQSLANPVGDPAFRVRSDFAAPLNADHGWAARLNENATVTADQPFRLRIEVEPTAGASGQEGFRLQYRRNEGDWSNLEAHDFPYPSREFEMDFGDVEVGTSPDRWYAINGDPGNVEVVEDGGGESVLRATAGDESLVVLYPPPWHLDEFSLATELRVPADDEGSVGLVFGFVDENNYWTALLDAGAGSIRVSRRIDGSETIVTEQAAGVVAGEWLEIEAKVEAGMLEINFQDDALEFTAEVGETVPASDLGFYLARGSRADFRKFVIEGEPSTPRVSIVATEAYENGAATVDLLQGSNSAFRAGAGLSLSERTPPVDATGSHTEFEWPLVIRYFSDGAVTNESGDTFEFRVTDETGAAIDNAPMPVLTLDVPAGHLGGTFVETPGRIGPWQSANGDLYFIMEPAESDNLFMMLKSTDNGHAWREMDAGGRPQTGDLESVDGRMVDGTIHIIHQVTESTRYHAFRTSDHRSNPDSWAVTDELATTVTARSQMASLVVRSDGSMVSFHVGDTIGYSVRSPSGDWSDQEVIGVADGAPDLAGPQAVLGTDDVVHLAYYRMDGTIWYRSLLADGTLTIAQQLASGVGTSEDDFGSVLPLVYIPETDTVVVIYRLADGTLWERSVSGGDMPSAAMQVTDRHVLQHAVDSQQVAADAVADGEAVHVLFIDQSDRSIYSTRRDGDEDWQPPTLQVDDIQGSWVRGNVYVRPDGVKVYGFVYDAGSTGGAGMNRFAEVVLEGEHKRRTAP